MYACRNRHTHRHTRTFRPLRTHAHKRVRAHTTHQHTHSLPQLLPLPQDSARGLWGQGAEPGWPVPGTLLASLPGDTHPTDRDDRAGHPRAGPAHAEPAAKQRRNHCAASAAPQAAAGTSRRKAWPRRRACAVRSRSTSPHPCLLPHPRLPTQMEGESRRPLKAHRPRPRPVQIFRIASIPRARGEPPASSTRPSLSWVSPWSAQRG